MGKYQLPEAEKKYFERLSQPFAVYQYVDKRVVTLALSDGFCSLFGYEDRDQAIYVMDNDMYRDVYIEDVPRIADDAIRFATEGGEYDVVYRSRTPKGSGYTVIHAHGVHVMTETGIQLAHVWYMSDGTYSEEEASGLTDLRDIHSASFFEESIKRNYRYDNLTGLPNLTWFLELAEEGKAAMKAKGKEPAMLYFDLNGMKYFNHKNGFAEGDRMLQAFARLLIRTFSYENCCHIGADRFVVYTKEEGLEEILQRFFVEAEKINGGDILSVRVGIFPSSIEEVSASIAYDRAKIACDTIPATGVSNYHFYGKELNEYEMQRRYIQTNIDRAIAEKWIKVYYQPIVRAVNQKICDEEALARWIDPEKGILSPAEFIPHLEAAGLIYKLDLYVLEQSLAKISALQNEFGTEIVPHSINLSRSDFDACDIVEEIRKRVDESGVARNKITIEITESIIGEDFDFMKEQILRFRELGFPVWMDDFGSGYSSLNVLQSIPFDLIKFDMSFLRKLDEGENGKIILTELMKMATALGVDTVCEGVETEEQARFLLEIGCSKLQGYYFDKPHPVEEIYAKIAEGLKFGFEDPGTSSYFESIGRVNLYDLGVVAGEDEQNFHHTFNSLPMGIVEIKGDSARFVRSNPSYREFMRRNFGIIITSSEDGYHKFSAAFMRNISKSCSEQGLRTFIDEKMPDGSLVRSFVRKLSTNPVDGSIAVAIAVLSISEPGEEATYADIARALAADYNIIYVIDTETDQYIEYTSSVGVEELNKSRQGADFFGVGKEENMLRIYDEDREEFSLRFTKETVLKELEDQGAFTAIYRIVDDGIPIYVSMKAIRLQSSSRVIIGISTVDAEMKQREHLEKAKQDRASLARLMAISEEYLALYAIRTETGHYTEYTASDEYEALGFAKEGEDFFRQGVIDAQKSIYPEDLGRFLEGFSKENILRQIKQSGAFKMDYRMMFKDGLQEVTLKIVSFTEGKESQLLASIRAWHVRHGK
ncbi:MAG: EAL domain-containing protein [Lachnospiraceae bacterium]|nr:EAL domain-containing protein [Lachnospiraceae bacterium]